MMLNHVHAVNGNECRDLDQDWIELISDAKQLGLTIEEIQAFLNSGQYVSRRLERLAL